MACLREIRDIGFVRKRLAHYKAQPDHREAALRLEAAFAPTKHELRAGRAASEHPSFVAPLPPADVGTAPDRFITFDQPEAFLQWCSGDWDRIPKLALQDLGYTDVWALVALGALCIKGRTRRPPVRFGGDGTAVRFAHALGLDALAEGEQPRSAEPLRTVALTSLRTREEIEPLADRMAKMVIENADAPDVRLAVRYVLVELLRNVVQHSGDSFGAVTAAQRMDSRQQRKRPMIQLAVADAGVGIPRALQKAHPGLADCRQALERALLPHISGTFDEGLTGSFENAGLGLYVVSEMARQTGGRLLIATTGAALVLDHGMGTHAASPRFLQPLGIGFPGTLVAFELPTDAVEDYYALIKSILSKAESRTPKRVVHRWLRFEPATNGPLRLPLCALRENTVAAADLAVSTISPAVLAKKTVELDFAGMDLCTQSWLHALLFESIRLAWALRVPIHVINADPAVREGLRFLEAYSLGG